MIISKGNILVADGKEVSEINFKIGQMEYVQRIPAEVFNELKAEGSDYLERIYPTVNNIEKFTVIRNWSSEDYYGEDVKVNSALILAIDFDGTLVRNHPTTHEIIEPIWDVVNAVKRAFEKGHTMILWTARQGIRETEAVEYCKNVLGLDFKYVNENCPAALAHPFGDARKIYADFYLDNKALTTWESLKAII